MSGNEANEILNEIIDPFSDVRAQELINEIEALEENDDSWTWLDHDPSVAWNCEPGESLHASLGEILERAGWERCYHREGARFHFNVKMGSSDSYRAFWGALNRDAPNADESMLEEIAQGIEEWEIQGFWEDLVYHLQDNLGVSPNSDFEVWQCGRSGGYANCSDLEDRRDAASMVKLGQHLERTRHYYNSREYGEWLAEETIDRYNEEKLEELASPKIMRIEA